MSNWFLNVLQKFGRKYALVDFYGDVQLYRYFVLFREDHFDDSWTSNLPNILIHQYPGEPGGWGPDGPSPHSHPWSSLGLLVKGGYTEVIDEKINRTTNAFGWSYVPYTSNHRLVTVIPGSISIFMHWFRRKDWNAHGYECKKVCDACEKFNDGVCMTEIGVRPFNPQMDSKVGVKGWRTMKFIPVDKNFDTTISERKAALVRMGVVNPGTSEAKLNIGNIIKLKALK